ncbi:hypothetical protein [Actinacidiphila acididurans]|uniref:Uncharacterized protein n=1 Tax=Actinacidiphila acididurans TaxID=2784346 RepID=A0ABS2U0I0_9ACTN|nr:hypothetical protein [Actinacidiphila acididurans]MBM9509095.1 hypothetical protein [Actinacidiphila acididurans]
MHVPPQATIELQTADGWRSFRLEPEETFYLSRKVIAQHDPELAQFCSRRPNCPQVFYQRNRWTMQNESESRRVRVAFPRGGFEEIGHGASVTLARGRTVIYFGPNWKGQVAVVVAGGAEPERDMTSVSGEVTYRGPEPTGPVAQMLKQGSSSRIVLVTVLAPWLSGDPALRDLRDRSVAAKCAGFSVGFVDKVLKEVRAALWPDADSRPSRPELAEYFMIRGLLGAADVAALPHVSCAHPGSRGSGAGLTGPGSGPGL